MNHETEFIAECYDKCGKKYHDYRKSKQNFFNDKIDWPAVKTLIGNVKGKKVLDVGCGSGIYSRVLQKEGAIVSGIDISRALLKIARKECPNIEFRLADASKIPYKNSTFDIAYGSLMMHYIKDWHKPLKEICRVLKPGGKFIFSINNPVTFCRVKKKIGNKEYCLVGYDSGGSEVFGNYFKEGWRDFHLLKGVSMKFHHKTYETIINHIIKSGFVIDGYKDSRPSRKSKKLDSPAYRKFSKLPIFCAFRLKK